VLSVEEHGAPEALRDLSFELGAETVSDRLRLVRAFSADSNLHELVRRERDVHGLFGAVGETLLAKLHDGLEMVAERTKVARLFAGERHGGE